MRDDGGAATLGHVLLTERRLERFPGLRKRRSLLQLAEVGESVLLEQALAVDGLEPG